MKKTIVVTIIFLSLNGLFTASGYTKSTDTGHPEHEIQSGQEKNPIRYIDQLIDTATRLTRRGEYVKMEPYADSLLVIWTKSGHARARTYGMMFKGHIASKGLRPRLTDSVYYYYESALAGSIDIQDMDATASIYNGLGIYSADVEMDYYKAMTYFMDALDAADKIRNGHIYATVVYNIALTYKQRNDPAGLPYGLEVYRMATESGDGFLVFMGALVTSHLYYLTEEYDKALFYAGEAIAKGSEYISLTEAYAHYANILVALDRGDEAEEYYIQALSLIGETTPDSQAMAYLSYGSYLISQGRSAEALTQLHRAEQISKRINDGLYRFRIYQQLSRAYEQTGQYHKALGYFKSFQAESDSIFNVERERSINDMRIKYETERTENELARKELVLLKARKRLHLSFVAIAGAMALLLMTVIEYRRKDRMYRQIVIREQEFMRKEDLLKNMRASENSEPRVEQPGGKAESKYEVLYSKLEELMQEQKIYREKDLSRDRLSKLLNTNRTYLSKALADCAGQTFYNYINTYRINEAVRLLSDLSSEMPVKAIASHLGYSSTSSFHTSFVNVIGMSPARYRKKIIELNRTKH